MSDQIVSRQMMFERGAAAFNGGRTRDSHGMNPWAVALPDWLAGYDHAAQVWHRATNKQAIVVMVEACEP